MVSFGKGSDARALAGLHGPLASAPPSAAESKLLPLCWCHTTGRPTNSRLWRHGQPSPHGPGLLTRNATLTATIPRRDARLSLSLLIDASPTGLPYVGARLRCALICSSFSVFFRRAGIEDAV